jgi:hypothetical protein
MPGSGLDRVIKGHGTLRTRDRRRFSGGHWERQSRPHTANTSSGGWLWGEPEPLRVESWPVRALAISESGECRQHRTADAVERLIAPLLAPQAVRRYSAAPRGITQP